MLPLTTAGITLAFSGGSVVIALISTIGQFWRVDALERATKELLQLAGTNVGATRERRHDRELLQLIRDAAVIAPHVRAAMKQRLFVALGSILALAFAASLDAPGPEIEDTRGLDWIDPIIYAVQLAIASLVNRKWLIRKVEREYLAHVGGLQDLYHERFVIPAIKGFDRKLQSSPIARELRAVKKAAEKRVGAAIESSSSDGT